MKKKVSFMKTFLIIFLGSMVSGLIINQFMNNFLLAPYILFSAGLTSLTSGYICIREYNKLMNQTVIIKKEKLRQTKLQTDSI